MKISELISELEKQKDIMGDVDVVVPVDELELDYVDAGCVESCKLLVEEYLMVKGSWMFREQLHGTKRPRVSEGQKIALMVKIY